VKTYVVLLRGINVGGKNKVPMAELRQCLEGLRFANVTTYIASGNVILDSERDPEEIRRGIEAALPGQFRLDVELIKVLVLSCDQLRAIVDARPAGFGEQPGVYQCDVIFLMDIDSEEATAVFRPREGVDRVWPGSGVIYSERLRAERAKSRLGEIVATPAYRCMTIRGWNTTVKLAELCRQRGA
jgi:uncharacterized protein (DUF1697 family)